MVVIGGVAADRALAERFNAALDAREPPAGRRSGSEFRVRDQVTGSLEACVPV